MLCFASAKVMSGPMAVRVLNGQSLVDMKCAGLHYTHGKEEMLSGEIAQENLGTKIAASQHRTSRNGKRGRIPRQIKKVT